MTKAERITWAVTIAVIVSLVAVAYWLWGVLLDLATVVIFFVEVLYRASGS